MKVIAYIIWGFLIFVLCLITLPAHLLVWFIFRLNTFQYMVNFLDKLTIKIFDDEQSDLQS